MGIGIKGSKNAFPLKLMGLVQCAVEWTFPVLQPQKNGNASSWLHVRASDSEFSPFKNCAKRFLHCLPPPIWKPIWLFPLVFFFFLKCCNSVSVCGLASFSQEQRLEDLSQTVVGQWYKLPLFSILTTIVFTLTTLRLELSLWGGVKSGILNIHE